MLLLEYLLRRRDVGPSVLLELHQPFKAGKILPLRLVVHHVGDVFLFDFLSRRSRVDTYRGHADGPSCITNSDENISIISFNKFSLITMGDHLQQRRFDRRFEALALA